MTWTQLLANNEVQRHKTSKNELDKLRAVIARDFADASLNGVSADRRFATAYNAALQAPKNGDCICRLSRHRRWASQDFF